MKKFLYASLIAFGLFSTLESCAPYYYGGPPVVYRTRPRVYVRPASPPYRQHQWRKHRHFHDNRYRRYENRGRGRR